MTMVTGNLTINFIACFVVLTFILINDNAREIHGDTLWPTRNRLHNISNIIGINHIILLYCHLSCQQYCFQKSNVI